MKFYCIGPVYCQPQLTVLYYTYFWLQIYVFLLLCITTYCADVIAHLIVLYCDNMNQQCVSCIQEMSFYDKHNQVTGRRW